jgi:hypothetical protein
MGSSILRISAINAGMPAKCSASTTDQWSPTRLENTFIPEVKKRREMHGYAGHAVLIAPQSSPAIEAMYAAHTIVPLPLPPHSSNQFQALDLSIFGVTKRHILRMNKTENLNVESKHIAYVVCSFMSAATPVNVVQTFRNAGVVLAVEEVRLMCRVDLTQARCLLKRLEAEDRVYVQEVADAIEDIEDGHSVDKLIH